MGKSNRDRCPDCGVGLDEVHAAGCDVKRITNTPDKKSA
jgi:hypothetical protein